MTTKDFFHVVIIGDSETGKSSLLEVFKYGRCTQQELPKVLNTFSHKITVDGKDVNLGLWDTSGGEQYEGLRCLCYPNCDVLLLCFSLSSRSSFEKVESYWLPEIKKHCSMTAVILVGTKQELRPHLSLLRQKADRIYDGRPIPPQRFVTIDEGMKMATLIGAMAYVECSSKSNVGVQEVFTQAAKLALQTSVRDKGKEKNKKKGGILGLFSK